LEDLAKYKGKDAIYFENSRAMHVTIKDINVNSDGIILFLTQNKTPGFFFSDSNIFSVFSVTSELCIYKNIIKTLNLWKLFLIKDIDVFLSGVPKHDNNIDLDNEFSKRNFKTILDTSRRYYSTQIIFPEISKEYRNIESKHIITLIDDIYFYHFDEYVKLPNESLNFMPDTIRDKKFFEYTDQQLKQLKDAGIAPDKRNHLQAD
jgi:hypothetical protein